MERIKLIGLEKADKNELINYIRMLSFEMDELRNIAKELSEDNEDLKQKAGELITTNGKSQLAFSLWLASNKPKQYIKFLKEFVTKSKQSDNN